MKKFALSERNKKNSRGYQIYVLHRKCANTRGKEKNYIKLFLPISAFILRKLGQYSTYIPSVSTRLFTIHYFVKYSAAIKIRFEVPTDKVPMVEVLRSKVFYALWFIVPAARSSCSSKFLRLHHSCGGKHLWFQCPAGSKFLQLG